MKTTKITISLFLLFSFLFSCSSDSIKEKINKSGDVAGQAIGEFASGVSTGVEKAVEPNIEISESFKSRNISFGKMQITNDSLGTDNVLIAYIIFNSDFKGSINVKAFDNKNLEMGRVKLDIKGKKDEAKYVEFHFDKRTNIDNDSKLVIE